jgi:hypothetical protein
MKDFFKVLTKMGKEYRYLNETIEAKTKSTHRDDAEKNDFRIKT